MTVERIAGTGEAGPERFTRRGLLQREPIRAPGCCR
jgi:hypothetical protein